MNEAAPPLTLLTNYPNIPDRLDIIHLHGFHSAGSLVLPSINPHSRNLQSNQPERTCGRGRCFKARFTGLSGESIKTLLGGLLKLTQSHRRPDILLQH